MEFLLKSKRTNSRMKCPRPRNGHNLMIQSSSSMGNGSDGSNFTLVGNKLINNKSSKSALKGSLRGNNDDLPGGKSVVESISAKVSSVQLIITTSALACLIHPPSIPLSDTSTIVVSTRKGTNNYLIS
eukprot:scaffold4845_cov159-Ochromonas_danica.AAC.17